MPPRLPDNVNDTRSNRRHCKAAQPPKQSHLLFNAEMAAPLRGSP
jgi:hypothetical protein